MKSRIVAMALVFAGAALASAASMAQADPKNSGYAMFGHGSAEANVWRSGSYGGQAGINDTLCWRTGYWTPAMAVAGCDPDLAKPAAAAPATPAAPAATPTAPATPPAAAPAAAVRKISLASKALFDFDKSVLKPEGRAAIDREIIAKLPELAKIELVLVTGHTDRIGSSAYNQGLSERRAETIRAYLVSKGVPTDRIESLGMGLRQPVTGNSCQQKNRSQLIGCLAPDRRVEVEVKGEAKQ
ncbi:MAG: OmpA family protein [Burkholderiales bacterium]|jgi:OOP family OmpA-OmpF porin|nr:OmpA family protein [Burkholderiales bacterium]